MQATSLDRRVRGAKILTYEDLVERGIVKHRTTLWRWVRDGDFPPPVKLGGTNGWLDFEVDDFVARIAAKRARGDCCMNANGSPKGEP